MAEFQEVMQQWSRMCHSNNEGNCDKCDVIKEQSWLGFMCRHGILGVDDKDIKSVETIITTWAAKHPKPVYPTWWEWLKSLGVLHRNDRAYSYEGIHEHIPEEFAKAHGIAPEESA